MYKHYGTIYTRCVTEEPSEGPLTVDQTEALRAFTDHRLYNASIQRFGRPLMDDRFDIDEATIKRDAEFYFRCMAWVVDATAFDGKEFGHICPGYYDCIRCYRD